MRTAELHMKDYEAVKASIISDIWFHIKDRDGQTLEIMERKGIPAIATSDPDCEDPETIDNLIVRNNKVIAVASSCFGDVNEYDIEEFEVPFLVAILDTVEKHLELEEEK